MAADITVTDAGGRGWTVRFVNQKEWEVYKRQNLFGRYALKAERLKKSWPDSPVFDGALAFSEAHVVHFRPADREKWLKDRELTVVRL